jgi:AraC-like DNA-binding protein
MPLTAVPPHVVDDLTPLRQRMAACMLRHVGDSGMVRPDALPDLMLARVDQAEDMLCGVYEPCVVVVLQGRKRVSIGDQVLHYDPQHFFVTSLDLPSLATILDARPEAPFLSIAVRLDLRLIATMLLEGIATPPAPVASERHAMATGRIEPALLEAFARLLALLDEPGHAPVLAPLVQREITYRLLSGSTGWRLRQIAAVDSQGHQISRAIELLKTQFAGSLRIEDLARVAHMSVSSLHHHFKAFTGMSPLQFQKQLRLAEARRLLLGEGVDAATAAYRVGYESPSQFSREYSRHFGAPPMRDIARLRDVAEAD